MAMALTLPRLVPCSGLTPLHRASPRCFTPSHSAYNFLRSCGARASQASRSRHGGCFSLGHDDIASSSVRVYSVKSEESCSGSGRTREEAVVLSTPVLGGVAGASALAAVAGSLMRGGVAIAEELAASSPVEGSDVGISTTVSFLFVAATIGLVVLTGGVIYLGLTEFLEKRALQEEQERVEKSQAKEKPSKQAAKATARSGGPKGFGSSRRTGTKTDDEEVRS